MDLPKTCYLISIIVALGLIVWGMFDLLKEKEKHETDIQVIQRQLRGFGYIILAQVIGAAGDGLCKVLGPVY